jgi:hypothetical protein
MSDFSHIHLYILSENTHFVLAIEQASWNQADVFAQCHPVSYTVTQIYLWLRISPYLTGTPSVFTMRDPISQIYKHTTLKLVFPSSSGVEPLP